MEISPVTRHEHFLARAAGDNNALELQPVTREEHFLQNIIDAIEEGGGGGGGSITIDDTMDPSSENPLQNKVIANELALLSQDLDLKESKPTVTDVSGTTPTIASAADNTIYECGEITSLTVTAIANPGDFIIRFTSGSTPTNTDFPATMKFPTADNLFPACSANTEYEINCSNGRAAWLEWPVLSS